MNSIEYLKQRSAQLHSKRTPLLSLWQELSENFYPERADFTNVRNLGDELASNMMTSYPIIARRDLGNAFGAMLRPSQKEWFKIRTDRREKEDTEAKRWLERLTGLMKRAMYARKAQFTRATKEADHDFATFGNAVLSTEVNRNGTDLLYRCWHLRDMAWAEDADGTVSTFFRNWKPTCGTLCQYFPKTVHPSVRASTAKDPFKEINCLHVVMPSEDYAEIPGNKKFIQPYVSCWLDLDNNHEMECVGSWTKVYGVPRWQTVAGSQYGHSPATSAALPDGRLIQAMTRVILEAGEKSVDPPMVAVKEAIRSDISIYAGGVTWVDAEYDERLGEVLRPLTVDRGGLNFGLDLVRDIRAQLADAFYLSKLNLPPTGGADMTAYEVGQRIQEYIRSTLPLFEPMEMDYNGQLCEQTLDLIVRNSPDIMRSAPKSIQGANIEFQFESPLREASDKVKLGQFMEAQQVLATALQFDPSLRHIVNGRKATRDVLEAIAPSSWFHTDDEVDSAVQAEQEQAQAAQMLREMQQGADVAKTLGEASNQAGQASMM